MQSEFINSDSPKPFRSETSETSEAQTYRQETGSSRAVSRARIFPSLVKALGWRVNDRDCGTNTPASLASYDRDTQSWRTSELSLFEGSIAYSGALPKSIMMRNAKIYALPMSERPTDGNACGSLPTPQKGEGKIIKECKAGSVWRQYQSGHQVHFSHLALMNCVPLQTMISDMEKIMGYPNTWTALNASGIALSLKLRS
jgi:hypothetical protein